jgi:hypothetical protein
MQATSRPDASTSSWAALFTSYSALTAFVCKVGRMSGARSGPAESPGDFLAGSLRQRERGCDQKAIPCDQVEEIIQESRVCRPAAGFVPSITIPNGFSHALWPISDHSSAPSPPSRDLRSAASSGRPISERGYRLPEPLPSFQTSARHIRYRP